MIPAGYSVKGATGFPALFIDKDRATDKAVLLRGTVTKLFSIPQIVKALDAAEGVATVGEAVDFLLDLEQSA